VGFSEVNSISIENNFDSINVGDIFELHVLAHDEKGNIFSSLEGWKFNWKIVSGHNNAQLIKLTEHGKMEVGDKREKIEKDGFHSDKILIKGSQTGKLLVNVEIVEENLKSKILSNQRELYVIEPFKIEYPKKFKVLPRYIGALNILKGKLVIIEGRRNP
jgi:nuclear pore complex protein Nup210